ncbi:MAG: PQQ-binding-like beta-propeller repeat protein, partial [Methanosarcinales archaeon]
MNTFCKFGMKMFALFVLLSCAGLFIGTASAQLADSPWPTFRHDMQRTGQSPYIGAQTNDLKWTYDAIYSIKSSPAIDTDGTIYFATTNDNLYAVYPNGTLKWKYAMGDNIVHSSPTIASDGT